MYSLLDGYSTPEEIIIRAKEVGMPAIALTDHGTLSGSREFQAAAEKHGIQPILGCEMYISPTDRFDRRDRKKRDDGTSVYNHLVVVAKDQDGFQNLSRLSERAWAEGFYYKPRIDAELLEEHASGLLVFSGCLNGMIAKAIEAGNTDEAQRITEWFKNTFDEDFYMEIQPHNPIEINRGLLDLADMYNIKPVVTLDCHYSRPEERIIEELLLIISTKPTKNTELVFSDSRKMDMLERLNYLWPERQMTFEQLDLYIMSAEDVVKRLEEQGITRRDVIDNTMDVLGKVKGYDYNSGLDLLPVSKTDPDTKLEQMAKSGLRKRGIGDDEYDARLQMELDVIKSKKFAPYFLVYADLVKWAKSKGVLVGPGRGSAAGSLVCYALGLTEVDPIKYGLLFGRFINEERNDFPDIDTDFQDDRRSEVKDYLRRKFKNVAQIATYVTFKDKNAIKDVSRALCIPLQEVEEALKPVETFEQFMQSPQTLEFRTKYPEVVEYSSMLSGRIRGTGMHPAGIVVSREPIEKFAPIEVRKDKKATVANEMVPVVAYDMDAVADIGLIKLDLLGLKTLTVISDTLGAIKDRHGIDIDMTSLPLDDQEVYKMISSGSTKGVFQAEAKPYTHLIMQMGIDNFGDLAVSNALVRPGAMNTIGATYVARKKGTEPVVFQNETMRLITQDTYGCIVYQEQVMQTCVSLAGMSWSEADKIRKIIGKKKDVSEFDAFRSKFVDGASKNVDREVAEGLWHDFEAHADYSFNKSHAIAYSMLSYWTAWLKHYYPTEFMWAVLKNEEDKNALTEYLIEAKRLGIKVLLPHINKSQIGFSIENDSIRFGLENVKYISKNIGRAILNARPFRNYAHVIEAMNEKGSGINTTAISSLDKIGGLSFEDHPRRGDESDYYYEYLGIPQFTGTGMSPFMLSKINQSSEVSQKGVYAVYGVVTTIRRGKGWSLITILQEDGTVTAFHDENSMLESGQRYVFMIADNRISRFISLASLSDRKDDAFIKYLSQPIHVDEGFYYVVDFKPHKTKAGKQMAYAVVLDNDQQLHRVMVFPKEYNKGLAWMKPGTIAEIRFEKTKDGGVYVGDVIPAGNSVPAFA
jgi:DNA polymerase III subunit alpha